VIYLLSSGVFVFVVVVAAFVAGVVVGACLREDYRTRVLAPSPAAREGGEGE